MKLVSEKNLMQALRGQYLILLSARLTKNVCPKRKLSHQRGRFVREHYLMHGHLMLQGF